MPTDAKPLIMGTRSIVAWRQGAKIQTRRLARPLPEKDDWKLWQDPNGIWWWYERRPNAGFALFRVRQPYAVGDLLWIREALKRGRFGYVLYATHPVDYLREEDPETGWRWTWKRPKLPAMFMPRRVCRHYAGVVSVRPERLQDISEEDAIAEGVLVGLPAPTTRYEGKTRDLYFQWWDSMHKKPGTRSEDNPWEWVYGIEEVKDWPEPPAGE